MSRNRRTKLRQDEGNMKRGKQKRKVDDRIRRTRNRLSNALVELILEKPIDKLTVQEVLGRAGVGRSTFYLHFRDKDDLFLSVLEEGLEMWTTALTMAQEKSHRVAPVAEFFGHVGGARNLYRAMVDSDRIHAYFDLAEGYFARGIARRLKEMNRVNLAERELQARSHALAGNLLSLLKWWLDRGAMESPHAMDELFHRIVWHGVQ